jgi:hypothetical protein
MHHALRTDDVQSFKDDEMFVRDCFDHLFSHLGRIGHLVRDRLVKFDDVAYPSTYSVRRMNEDPRTFYDFMTAYKYTRAAELSRRLGLQVSAPSEFLCASDGTAGPRLALGAFTAERHRLRSSRQHLGCSVRLLRRVGAGCDAPRGAGRQPPESASLRLSTDASRPTLGYDR